MRYVAFLRAINVGGTSIIRMADLKDAFEDIGFTDVKTYIQSGNVIFSSSEKNVDKLETKIAKTVATAFETKPEIMVRTLDELKGIVCSNPFPATKLGDNTKLSLYVAFLKSAPTKEQVRLLDSFENEHEKFVLVGKEIYCLIRKSLPRTRSGDAGKAGVHTKGTFEKKLGIPMTIRNYLTMAKMLEWLKK